MNKSVADPEVMIREVQKNLPNTNPSPSFSSYSPATCPSLHPLKCSWWDRGGLESTSNESTQNPTAKWVYLHSRLFQVRDCPLLSEYVQPPINHTLCTAGSQMLWWLQRGGHPFPFAFATGIKYILKHPGNAIGYGIQLRP